MSDELHLLVVPHTHWDREWYQTFQQFRLRLVHAVDTVLHTLDSDPDFTFFMLDGQTVVLEDYLEVRPENAARLQTLGQQGRLLVGPWYLQPDEFLVGGESLIRNLQIGHAMAIPYGGPMAVGYVPDTFGHTAQLPQILRGFGLDNAVFWRGVGPEIERGAFRWLAPDGSDVLVAWLYDEFGYSNAAMLPLEPDLLAERVRHIADRMRARAVTNTLLLMNGSDHREPQPGLPSALAAASERLRASGLTLAIGTLPQYIETLRAATDDMPVYRGELRSSYAAHLLPGVLSARMWLKQRNAAVEALLTHWAEPMATWSWLFGAEHPTSLLQLAWKFLLHNHPHDSICGCGIDQVHREMLPRFDQSEQIADGLAADALTFLAGQVDTRGSSRSVPAVVFNPTDGARTDLVHVKAHMPLAEFEVVDADGRLLPHQTLSTHSAELLDQEVDKLLVLGGLGVASEGSAMGYVLLDARVGLSDRHDHPTIEVIIAQHGTPNLPAFERLKEQVTALSARDDITAFRVIVREPPRTEMLVLARDVPGRGGRVLFLQPRTPTEGTQRLAHTSGTLRVTAHPEQLALENTHLFVGVEPDTGSLTLLDKRSGRAYSGLNAVEDSGDVGDLYTYCPPRSDTCVRAPAWPPAVAIVEGGPVRATMRITRTYLLPRACTTDRSARSGDHVTCVVTSDVSLVAGARRVEIRTTVENVARDHRLRVLFPVPFVADWADAEGVFEVRRRPATSASADTGHDAAQAQWAETPVSTYPQKRFVDVSDDSAGLAVLNRGLAEYEVMPNAATGGSVVAITLLRCVEWLSRDDLATRRGHAGPMLHTPEAQGPGRHTFEYALVPHTGTWRAEDTLALHEAQAFETPLRAVVTEQHPGRLPNLWSFAHVTPACVVVSAMKRAEREDALVIRLHNPLDEPLTAEVILPVAFTDVREVNLNEEETPQSGSRDVARFLSTGVRASLRGGEIKTLLFRFAHLPVGTG